MESAWRLAETLAGDGQVAKARALLETAHRRAKADQNLALALALMRLQDGDPAGAAMLFADVARRSGVREAWTGWAAASLLTGDPHAALDACECCLRSHVADAPLLAAAHAVMAALPNEAPGWCNLTDRGEVRLSLDLAEVTLALDGAPLLLSTNSLPPGWEKAAWLDVRSGGQPLLGSPIDVQAILRVEGFVERSSSGVKGWAWHPGAPDTDPPLRLLDAAGSELFKLVATDLGAQTQGDTPCARPRRFAFDVRGPGTVRVVGRDGRDLAGSPVAALPRRHRAGAALPKTSPAATGPVDIVIPVYRGLLTTIACIESVRETVPPGTNLWVVDDGSPDRDLVASLRRLEAEGLICLIGSGPPGSERANRGFPAAANAGLRAAAGRDVILLNSDTLVAPGWVETLQSAAHSAADIGTTTPISNEASIVSVPNPAGGNPAPDGAGTRRMAALAARANAGWLVDIPTAHGFCMFIRADCLAETGLFREDLFAQGYGEENDFCSRASAVGWRHVAVPSVYVAHVGGASFGASRKHLLARNQELLARLHPSYPARVAAHIAADPLFRSRRRLDAEIWRTQAAAALPHQGAVLVVTHEHGGGTARVVRARAAVLREAGFCPLLLLGRNRVCVLEVPGSPAPTPNLRIDLPKEWLLLADLLELWRPVAIEMHHLLGHHPSMRTLPARLGLPVDMWVHDYACLCPRISLVDGEGRYCGEPPPSICDACVARWGRADSETLPVTAVRARSARALASARRVLVPSADVGRRLQRHFPACSPQVGPWAAEAAFPPIRQAAPGEVVRVAIVGALGVEKGFSVILACAADSAARNLNLFFTIIGYTTDDDALEATGRVTISGPFEAEEASGLIAAQGAHLGFIPSIWPETWCFALTEVWDAGLPACVFDLGAQADRVRETGRGWVIPLGLPPGRVNDTLMALAGSAGQTLPPGLPRGTIRPPGERAR